MSNSSKAQCRVTKMTIPTYPEPEKEKLPMYCENRIHQRTSGKVYPNAIINDVVRDHKIDREYTAVILENDFVELIILPEIGGRIFGAKDKVNGYDFFYRQHVIKPALIGLFGSWMSGGAEFNWPMHHRPSTFMPTDFEIVEEDDGAVTVWLSEHEPLDRMKGMVGISVHPAKAMFETKMKLYNRNAVANSFLWWENIAVPVNHDYQLFFPPDVDHVCFHYKKSVTNFPIADCMFNGIDYRSGDTDISWHKNTVKSTSYFSARSNYDFFGGFDYGKNAGVVHIADHYVSPGKKMFTWAYNQLSKSWEKALTDTDGAYAELMAGCYTDNQPDFSWIEPYEVKEFSQFWYPIREIGKPQNANTSAALSFAIEDGKLKLKLYAVSAIGQGAIEIYCDGKAIADKKMTVGSGEVFTTSFKVPVGVSEDRLEVMVKDNDKEVVSYCKTPSLYEQTPEPRPEFPSPGEMEQPQAAYLMGLHYKQYRDPLVNPNVYWKRAVDLDPAHYSSLNELGLSAMKAGKFVDAENYFVEAVAAQTSFNPNPEDGEPRYNLGLALKYQGKIDAAYDAFYKSIWNYQWRSAGYFALAQIDCMRGDLCKAKEHLKLSLSGNGDNRKAAALLVAVERLDGNSEEALKMAVRQLEGDPLDYLALSEMAILKNSYEDMFAKMSVEPSQTMLDIAFDYTGAGLHVDAVRLIKGFIDYFGENVSPMIHYTHRWLLDLTGDSIAAEQARRAAAGADPDYCFPARHEEMNILRLAAGDNDARAAYYLGNLLYGKGRHAEALAAWEKAFDSGEEYFVLFRNLGMAYYNVERDGNKALILLNKALKIKPNDPQLVFELNYLMQLLNGSFADRLELLEKHRDLVENRDDLYMELVRVNNQLGQCEKSIELLKAHTFTPCEGGEHALVELWIFAHFKLGREAMAKGEYLQAANYFQDGQVFPDNLGAGIWNIVMNVPAMYYEAQCLDQSDRNKALELYHFIAEMGVDFFTYMYQPGADYYRALAFRRLGETDRSDSLLKECIVKWEDEKVKTDHGFFKATPFFISYLEDPADVRAQQYNYLLGLTYGAMGESGKAVECYSKVLEINSGHVWAALEKSMI